MGGFHCYVSLILGLSSFVNVTQLDLSHNCLSDLNCVKTMATLKQLQTLQLAGERGQVARWWVGSGSPLVGGVW